MCGRFVFDPDKRFYPRFKIKNAISLTPRYNISPGQKIPVIVKSESDDNYVEEMKWGLVPSWAKDPKIGYKMINARVETLKERPAFREALIKRRCIIPASGYYEWKKDKNGKIPYYIHSKDKEYFSIAGLFEIWKDEKGIEHQTVTIITKDPDPSVSHIHDRMPAILTPEEEDAWLSNKTNSEDAVKLITNDNNRKDLEAYQITDEVNDPRNQGEELIKPV